MIEVIIASGLMIIVGLGIATLITGMEKNQRTIMERTEQKNYSTIMRSALQVPQVISKSAATTPGGPN